jgi:proline dehydrogenase
MKPPFAFARRFVAGESFDQALPAIRTLTDRGLLITLDLLGEYVSDRRIAERARDAYIELVRVTDASRNYKAEANISIKLSMLGQKIDETFCLANLRQLLDAARHHDVFVRLDMEGSDITASTLRLFEEVYPTYPDHVGVVLQAYLKRTAGDVDRMCELNARVRLCKGAYKEPAEIAYQDMPTIRERFVSYAKQLIQHGRYPGIATHDDRLIQAVKDFVTAESIPHDRFEFQMLYGIRPRTQLQIHDAGFNMRVYIPYGTEWMPYFSRRLRERKENIWFVVKHLVKS